MFSSRIKRKKNQSPKQKNKIQKIKTHSLNSEQGKIKFHYSKIKIASKKEMRKIKKQSKILMQHPQRMDSFIYYTTIIQSLHQEMGNTNLNVNR